MTPLLRFTRLVFVVGVCLTAGTGIGLFAVPDRTGDYWAWTIKDPLSAAFFGAGYVSAALSLALAARERVWEQARIVAVAAFTLTSTALLATLLHRAPFAFGDGGLPEVVAWIWLAVYVALPPLVLAALLRQELVRGPRGAEYPPALGSTRALLGVAGLALAVLGALLLANLRGLADRWPWPLPPLPASVLGAWLCTYGVTLLWFAVRERSWVRARIAVLPALVVVALDAAAAIRFRGDFRGGTATAVYVAALAVLGLAVTGAALAEAGRGGRHARLSG